MNRSGLVTGVVAVAMALSACSSKGDSTSSGFGVSSSVVEANKVIVLPNVNGWDVPYAAYHKDTQNNDVDGAYFRGDEASLFHAGVATQTEDLAKGYHEIQKNYDVANFDGYSYRVRGSERIYNQPYSIIYGRQHNEVTAKSNASLSSPTLQLAKNQFNIDQIVGYDTPSSQMPTSGTAVYRGKAFSGYGGTGELRYEVNFDNRRGEGRITGIADTGTIELNRGYIGDVKLGAKTMRGIESSAYAGGYSGNYQLGFFGPNAEEVAGRVTLSGSQAGIYTNGKGQAEIGFGGQR
ncbi:factor H binding protein domain-containing protein [uncultured Moraxella sp.]|uniref:factor H binding protein domain-containing protein n=1 Tax=uncultured Moraxella sp. TaxID=263769 RepID=UPI0025F90C59|nr:factor H binding protein domain-containing protein [uncultured Moraxella sp.]